MHVYKLIAEMSVSELSETVSDYIYDGEWELYGNPFTGVGGCFQAIVKNTIDEPVNNS